MNLDLTRRKIRLGPEGIHIFSRDSGLNILVDEIRPPERAWSVAPRFVSFALTNACELECPYCYAPKHPARLPIDALLAWSIELDQAGTLGIGFGGGEPTLYPRFADLCGWIHSQTQLAVSVTTHGHRWTESLVSALAGNLDFVRISMDGIRATYERLRGRSFATFLDRLERIGRNFKFGVNFVVNADTIEEVDEAAELAFGRGAQEFLLLPEVGAGGGLAIDARVQARLDDWVGANYARRRIAISATSAEILSAPILPLTADSASDRDFLHVDALGLMKRCAYEEGGVRLAPHQSIIDAIVALRNEINGGEGRG